MQKGVSIMAVDASFHSCPEWVNEPMERKNIKLYKHTTPEEVDLFLIALFGENSVEFSENPRGDLEKLITEYEENGLICAGGIVFYDQDTIIYPSCCCGIESYMEVVEQIQKEETDIWLGHDPFPTVEYAEKEIIIWADAIPKIQDNAGIDKNKIPSIIYEKEDLKQKLSELNKQVKEFIFYPLSQRIFNIAPQIEKEFTECMLRWLS